MIPLSVLVVHPDASVAARIARAVAVAGHAPVLLADGERAIDRFVQEPADVVIVDYFLPGRDGVATIEAIRWAPGGRDAHVVLLAEREPDGVPLETLGLRIGALLTLVGPVDDARLARVVGVLSRPPGETTRIASADEIGGHLERLGFPARARSSDDASAAWPVVETVMARATPRDALPDTVPPAPDASTPAFSPYARDPDADRERGDDGDDGLADCAPVAPPVTSEVLTTELGPARAGVEGGSGIVRRPGAPAPRLTTPPPAPSIPELTPSAGTRSPEAIADAAALEEGRGVGDVARASEEGSQRFVGRFEETTFAALLQRLADQRASGALVCVAEGSRRETTTGDPPTKVVYFRSGVPVHVRSNLLDECLGQILLRRRRIGAATLEESIRRMRLGHGLQGEILVDMGALAPLDLGEALADQARDKLFDLFGWTRGTYRLSPRLEVPASAVGIELSLAEIVYEGVCAAMAPTRLFELLSPHLAHYVVPDPVQLARVVRVRLVPEARHVLAKVDGTQTLREILSMGTRPGAVAQLVFALECLGAVRFEEAPRGARGSRAGWRAGASEDVPRGAPLESAPLADDVLVDDALASDELPEPLEGASTEPPAPADDVPPIRGMLDTPLPAPPGPSLGPTLLGPTPLAPTRGTGEPVLRPASTEEWDDPTAPLRDARDARLALASADVASADVGPADVAGTSILGPGVARADASGMLATPEQDEQRTPGPADAEHEPSSADHASPLDARVDVLFEAERHFRRGNRALDRGRLDEALAAFSRAYELCPDQGEFLAYVGWARHCLSPEDPAATALALEELARARELSADIHVTHLLHARVLATAGRAEEAQGAYLRVLQLDPANAEARDALDRFGWSS